jgi:hypothetical protein
VFVASASIGSVTPAIERASSAASNVVLTSR